MASRILVAEDEAIIALDLKEKLETIGYTVVDVAATGEDACALADRHRPDLVLMDIMMPGRMDGAEAAARIRESFNIPSVYLTAFATDAVVARAKAAGAYGYIIKPYSQNQLKAAIDVALTRSRLDLALRISEARYRAIVERVGDVGITVSTLPEAGQKDPNHVTHRLRILTPNELEVANMIRDGLLSKEIADQLCISIRTVETHRLNIRKKLGLSNAATQLRQFLIREC